MINVFIFLEVFKNEDIVKFYFIVDVYIECFLDWRVIFVFVFDIKKVFFLYVNNMSIN